MARPFRLPRAAWLPTGRPVSGRAFLVPVRVFVLSQHWAAPSHAEAGFFGGQWMYTKCGAADAAVDFGEAVSGPMGSAALL